MQTLPQGSSKYLDDQNLVDDRFSDENLTAQWGKEWLVSFSKYIHDHNLAADLSFDLTVTAEGGNDMLLPFSKFFDD